MFRIGIGQDSHKFINKSDENNKEKKLVLGGKIIEGEKGLKAHSDGDVIIHAIMAALLGAIGGRSLGHYFSDKDETKQGTSSTEYLKEVRNMVKEKGFAIHNIDVMVECKRPKIEPHVDDMKNNIAKILKIKKDQIAIKAHSGEGLTSFGKGKGIYATAIALVEKKKR